MAVHKRLRRLSLKNIVIDSLEDGTINIRIDDPLDNKELIMTWHSLTGIIIENSKQLEVTKEGLIKLIYLIWEKNNGKNLL